MDRKFDFVFSCPPYYDLEVYCDDPNDLSNMSHNEFNRVYESIIAKSCALLKDNRYACFVVGNCRDKDGYMMDLVGTTIRAFEKCGVRYYNEIVLVMCPDYGTQAYIDAKLPRAAMEHTLNQYRHKNDTSMHSALGTYIYGELNESKYVYHLDGRKTKKS